MKKRSFFERLAGNLRFNEDELEETGDTAPLPMQTKKMKVEVPDQRRELSISTAFVDEDVHEKRPMLHHEEEEEVGQLPVDLYETNKEVVIQTLIAGVLPEHLTINITRDVVSISGKREENKAIPQDSYHIQELYWGAFERVIDLPVEVEIDNAEAIERHGLLMIKLPKLDKGRKTSLKIKSI